MPFEKQARTQEYSHLEVSTKSIVPICCNQAKLKECQIEESLKGVRFHVSSVDYELVKECWKELMFFVEALQLEALDL
ncbi:hypothetical protein HYPBUDRAFT_153175, partial [Hyphopichia burtonii NRRL Y-1933]